MNNKIKFIDNTGRILYTKDTTLDSPYIVMDSPDINFKLVVLPPMNLIRAIDYYRNTPKENCSCRLCLDWLKEIKLIKYKRLLQKIYIVNSNNTFQLPQIIAAYCNQHTQNWWIFLFVYNDTYRIICGVHKCILISRFIKINTEEELNQELYNTFMFAKRHDDIEKITLFSTVPINCSIFEIFDFLKIDTGNAIEYVIEYAINKKLFKPKFRDNFIKKISAFSVVIGCIFLGFAINNLYKYIAITDKIQITEEIRRKFKNKISSVFGSNNDSTILKYLTDLSKRSTVFDKLKHLSLTPADIKSYNFIKNKSYIKFNKMLSEKDIYNTYKNIKWKPIKKPSLQYEIGKQEKYQEIEILLP